MVDLLSDLGASARGWARGLALRIVEDIARRGEVATLLRRVADLNRRLAAMEPRGEPRGVCQVCGGALHVLARDLPINAGGVHVRRTLLRCARCWALRPVDTLDGTGEAGVSL